MAKDREDVSTQLPDETVTLLNKRIIKSPHGALLGLELVDAAEDCVRLSLPYRTEVKTLVDIVHGGTISSLVHRALTASFRAGSKIAVGHLTAGIPQSPTAQKMAAPSNTTTRHHKRRTITGRSDHQLRTA